MLPAAAALGLGLWGIDRGGGMWRDESVTYQVAHRSLPDLLGLLGDIDAVHGLYYLLMHAVFGVWDGGLLALRLPSVAATAVAAAGVGAVGRRLAGTRAGVLSGLAFPLLPLVQQYAQEGRSYAMVCAAVSWATYLLLRGAAGGGRRVWAGYEGLLAVACWLHEFAALALVAHGVTLWRSGVPRAVRRSWARAALVVAAAVLPLAAVSAGQADRQLGWLGRPGAGEWLLFAAVSGAGVLLVLLCRAPGRGPARRPAAGPVTPAGLALPLLVVPAGLLMTVSLVKPWYVDRYVLYGYAGLALLAGTALDRVLDRLPDRAPERMPGAGRVRRPVAVCLAVACPVTVLLPWSQAVRSPESRKDDVVAVAETVRATAVRGDAVLFMPARRREWLLSFPSLRAGVRDLALDRPPAASRTLQGTELPAAEIRRRILAEDRIVALTDPAREPLDALGPEAVKRETLTAYFRVCGTKRVHGAQVVVYARPGRCGRPAGPSPGDGPVAVGR